MIISLTNASPIHKDKQIAINSTHIVSMFTDNVFRDGAESPETVTFIYCPPHGTWEVQESIEEIIEKINGPIVWSTP